MPAMRKAGGGGHYGVAQVRMSKSEVTIQDVDTSDRYVFPLDVTAPPKSDKSNLAALLRGKKAGQVVIPKTQDWPERRINVYPGTFEYGVSAKGDRLTQFRPASGTHLCHFVGFKRGDPNTPPTWELKASSFDSFRMDKQFDALFRTSDDDEFPGLDIKWGFWNYTMYPDKNDNGQDVMSMSLLPLNAGAGYKAQYELYRCAQIIGRDQYNKEAVIVDIPGALENYLPAIETILLKRIGAVDFALQFETYSHKKTGATKVRITGLYKQPGQDKPSKKK